MSTFQQNRSPEPDEAGTDAFDLRAFLGRGPRTRDELAEFMRVYGARVRRRIRGKVRALTGTGGFVPLAWLDEDDILSTVTRRVDAAMLAGKLRTDNPAELCAYINTITDNAFKDRLHDGIREQRALAAIIEAKPGPPAEFTRDETAHTLIEAAPTESGRHLLILRSKGASYTMIAAATGRTRQALRTQWSLLRRLLRISPPPPSSPRPRPLAPTQPAAASAAAEHGQAALAW